MKEIDLENMTGEEFEILCQEIFSKYYSVSVERTPLVGDGGKDLIIRFDEPVYVECKHHKSTIGRPVVQKLHSAMVTDWVKKGIIVTTGEFSPQAIKHIKDNNLPIELIDGHKLEEMAAKVGIKIYFGYDVNLKEAVIDNPPEEAVREAMLNIITNIDSGPVPLDSFYSFQSFDVVHKPYYSIYYSVNQDFFNSKKTILIDSIKESGKVLLDADTLEECSPQAFSFYSVNTFIPASEAQNPPHFEPKHIRLDVEKRTYDLISEKYTKEVTYRSTNDVRYTRTLTPSRNHIELSGLMMVYLPTVYVNYKIYSRLYREEFYYNGRTFARVKGSFCPACGKVPASPAICCSCAQVFCKKHLKQCEFCHRNVCSNCWTKYKAGFLKTRVVCKECKKSYPGLKYKT